MNADADLPPPSAATRGGVVALMLAAAALAGLVAGAFLASTVAGFLADWLDLGQAKERLVFAFFSSLLGAPAGMAAGIWLVLRTHRPGARIWRGIAGFAAGAGLAALVAFAFLFAITTPPPPVLPYLHVEVRIAPAPAPLKPDDTFLTVFSGRDGRGSMELRLRRDANGRNLAHGTFWLSRQNPVDHLVLYRRGLPQTRFTLNLPSDPPSTGDFTHWLSADRPFAGADDSAGETIEMRFRIDRRVER